MQCEIKTVLSDCPDCCKSCKTQVLEHRLHVPHALRDHSHCMKKNNTTSKSNGVLLLKERDYYLVQRSSQQEASDERTASCVMAKSCECGKRSAGKAVDIHREWSYHILTKKVIN